MHKMTCFVIQVIVLKGDLDDYLVLDPDWLCGTVCGAVMAPGLTGGQFRIAHQKLEEETGLPADKVVPILEAMGIGCQLENNNSVLLNSCLN